MTHDVRDLRALGDLAEADRGGARQARELQPGEWLAAAEPAALTTSLGAGVAVCLWDPQLRLGGLAHFVSPDGPDAAPEPGRQGRLAIPRLIADLVALGCAAERMRAKVFGGSGGADPAPPDGELGARNVALADELLADAGIPVIGRDTGGERARKLVLHTDDFSVWVWRIR